VATQLLTFHSRHGFNAAGFEEELGRREWDIGKLHCQKAHSSY
jgi:hypothetical protein